jgi:hypothetical protein
MLPKMFRYLVALCKENYGYEISYGACVAEVDLVPWSDRSFDYERKQLKPPIRCSMLRNK